MQTDLFPFKSVGTPQSTFVSHIANVLYNLNPQFRQNMNSAFPSAPQNAGDFVRFPTYEAPQQVMQYDNQPSYSYQPDPWAFSYGLKNFGNLFQPSNMPANAPAVFGGLLGPNQTGETK